MTGAGKEPLIPWLAVGAGMAFLFHGYLTETREAREAYEEWWKKHEDDPLDHRAAWTAGIAWQKNRPRALKASRCRSALVITYNRVSRDLAAELMRRHPKIPPVVGACAIHATLQRAAPELHAAYHYEPKGG